VTGSGTLSSDAPNGIDPKLASLTMDDSRPIPRVLSIAGSDSGGGAGIQADLKAIAACGAHGMTAITAITAQNTVGVTAVLNVPPAIVRAQVEAVVGDIGVDAVKLGMLGNVETVQAVADALAQLDPAVPVVIDPVMVSESGAVLLEQDARGALIRRLFPRATVVTPNLPEARTIVETALSGSAGAGADPGRAAAAAAALDGIDPRKAAPEALARAIRALGPAVVVVTGGHREVATDVFFDGQQLVEIPGERHGDGAAHGSGCTHASVLASHLAAGEDPLTAARAAKQAASRAVADGLRELGAGAGPVDVLGLRRITRS
jgi:hydroxymethylpyrimidine/phosphomethylpyrimidine kinase